MTRAVSVLNSSRSKYDVDAPPVPHSPRQHHAFLGIFYAVQIQVLVTLRSFDPSRLRPLCGAFHPEGLLLAVGFSSGVCKIVDASDLQDIIGFRHSLASLVTIRFSPDGEMVR